MPRRTRLHLCRKLHPGGSGRGLRQYREGFARDGFVVVPGFLDAAALDELRANIERYVRDVVPDLPPSQAFYVDRSRPDTLKQLQGMSVDP